MPRAEVMNERSARFRSGEEIADGLVAWTLLSDGRLCDSWMAWSTVHGRPVTVKICQRGDEVEDARRVLRREASYLSALRHPGFQQLLGSSLDGPEPFLVLEYVEGYTLETILDVEGRFAPVDALNVVSELVAALGYLHRLGIAHLDVKPANAILRDGRVVLMDLGLAQPLGTPMSPASPRGTRGYIAPEQWCRAPASPAMDLFSAGCLLHALVTRAAPYDHDGPPAAPLAPVRRRRGATVVERQVIDTVVAALASIDPSRRVATADEALLLIGRVRDQSERTWPTFVDDALGVTGTSLPDWAVRPTRAS